MICSVCGNRVGDNHIHVLLCHGTGGDGEGLETLICAQCALPIMAYLESVVTHDYPVSEIHLQNRDNPYLS